jgi:hypothetical protein
MSTKETSSNIEVCMMDWLIADEMYPVFKKGDYIRIMLEMYLDGRMAKSNKKEEYLTKTGDCKFKFSAKLKYRFNRSLIFNVGKYNFMISNSDHFNEILKPENCKRMRIGAYYTGEGIFELDGREYSLRKYIPNDNEPELLFNFKIEKIQLSALEPDENKIDIDEDMSMCFRGAFDFPNLTEVERTEYLSGLDYYILQLSDDVPDDIIVPVSVI